MDEIWKDIEGFEGYYQVSNLGNVKSLDRQVGNRFLKGRDMKLTLSKSRKNDGYLVVNLRKYGANVIGVHRLVAMAFIKNPDNLPIPHHIDGNKSNNRVDNLEWLTYAENNQNALDDGLRNPRGRVVVQYSLNMDFISEYKSGKDASKVLGLNYEAINQCLNLRNKTSGGFIWKYKDNL